jgi:hypothetical protein
MLSSDPETAVTVDDCCKSLPFLNLTVTKAGILLPCVVIKRKSDEGWGLPLQKDEGYES